MLSLSIKTPVIGLDIGARCFKAVQLDGAASHRRVKSAMILPRLEVGREFSAKEVKRLHGALSRQGFRGDLLVANAPHNMVFNQILELPGRDSGAPVEQLARFELARLQKLSADEIEMVCWDLPGEQREGKSVVYAAACRHEQADQFVDLLEAESFDVGVLTTSGCALMNACRPLLAKPAGVSCLLDLGWQAANLMMIFHDSVFYTRRHEDVGLTALLKAIRDCFSVSDEMSAFMLRRLVGGFQESAPPDWERLAGDLTNLAAAHLDDLVRELEISCSYARHQYADAEIEQLLITGGGALLPGLSQRLEQALSIPVKVVRPCDVADCSALTDAVLAQHPALTTALGLALCDQGDQHAGD